MEKIICKDHTVSHERFELQFDSSLEMYATHPQPTNEKLPHYYKSVDYISHTDASKTILDKIYQAVKKYAIGKKIALLESFKTSQKNLLDVGCGTGDFLKVASDRNWKISGIEPNQQARKIALEKLGDANSVVVDLDKLINIEPTKQYDIITLWHVLEHIPNYDAYIIKLKSLLKNDGHLLIAVPNFKSYDAQYYKDFWAAYDVPRHLWHFSKNAIHKIFDKHQMQISKTIPMYFDSYYVSLLSEKYKTGKSNVIKAAWIGFLSNWKAKKSTEYSSLIYLIKNK